MKNYQVAVINGDGIGPEIMREGLKVVKAALKKANAPSFTFTEVDSGAELYLRTGETFPVVSKKVCDEADATYLSATGLPDVKLPDGTGVSVAWELRVRHDLFAAVRPLILYHEDFCPLKGKKAGGIRFTIVRENSEGLYSSRGAGVKLHDEVVINAAVFTRKASERIMKLAFDMARRGFGAPSDGKKRVTCVDKSNVLAGMAFSRAIYDEVSQGYPDIEKDYCFVDAMALMLVQRPEHYNIVVTENMHGDILSDLGAGLVGGLGYGPSGNIGANKAMFEPSHGTAPTIAGKNIANPVATILSGAMMLEWLGSQHNDPSLAKAAKVIDDATAQVLAEGKIRTADSGGRATTSAMGDAIALAVESLDAAELAV